MRMRLGILHDPEAQQRMHDREKKALEEKKRREETPMVRTEEQQRRHDEQKAKEEAEGKKKEEEKPHKIKIRPLSEARAIELGANFFSEAFIFAVAAGLIVWDTWRSRKKESARRDDVAERLEQLESEVESLRSQLDPDLETLHDLSERIKAAKKTRQSGSWYNPLTWGKREAEDSAIMEEEHDIGKRPKDEDAIVPIRNAKAIAGASAESEKEKRAKESVIEQAKQADKKPDEKNISKGDGKPPVRVDSTTASTKER